MIRTLVFLLLMLLCLADAPGQSAARRLRLSDGKTFQGWEGDTGKTWRIVEGAFVGGSVQETVPHNEFLCTTRSFKNFDLRLQVKLVGTEGFVNGGVQFRSRRIQNPPYEVSGYQADMGDGYWGSLYDESRRNKALVQPEKARVDTLVKKGEWNDYRIRCQGPHIEIWLNGTRTVDYTEPDDQIPQDGIIGVQVHGMGKTEASYRQITIAELP